MNQTYFFVRYINHDNQHSFVVHGDNASYSAGDAWDEAVNHIESKHPNGNCVITHIHKIG